MENKKSILLAGLAVLFVLVIYIWFSSLGTWRSRGYTSDYYSRLTSAFLHRQLFLEQEPDPALLALPNPYDPKARKKVPDPPLLFFIMFIDGTWGAFIHAGENLLKDGRLGFLNNIVLTPSHHRVHHARNPLYMDTNFCNLLNIWDKVFGTIEHEKNEVVPEYGITREMNANSFVDVYFGEIFALWKDVKDAPGFMNKVRYLIMPPGWSHSGNHKTAKLVRGAYLKAKQQ